MSVSVDVGVMWRLSEDFNRRFGLRMQPAPTAAHHPHHAAAAAVHHYHHHHQHHLDHTHGSIMFNGEKCCQNSLEFPLSRQSQSHNEMNERFLLNGGGNHLIVGISGERCYGAVVRLEI
ncbi:uncharacterized protein LOC117188837 [Drosophila miranda]|uniref:uncharacterized protein LOC117188837 n=1 Tax=Drosophila miranda TaxID=7229 RepID=UPI00143F3A30|nr:uncharacterized protein LOC117188837 [Drosophila miranda]